MAKPPPEDLMEWPKAELVREVARLRAITREHAERLHDESRSGGDSVGGSPYGRGDSVLDMRGAVLLDYNEVVLVDSKRDEPPAVALLLEGRVNYEKRRVKQMYVFGTDGAAALVTQLVGLAARAGGEFAAEFKQAFDERLKEMP
jgi:hypothetical protein